MVHSTLLWHSPGDNYTTYNTSRWQHSTDMQANHLCTYPLTSSINYFLYCYTRAIIQCDIA